MISGFSSQEEMIRVIIKKYQKQQALRQYERAVEHDVPKKDYGKKDKHPYVAWQSRFEELIEFKLKHRHCLVPYTYPQNQALACWVKRQRYDYKQYMKRQQEMQFQGSSNVETKMTEPRIRMLNEVGFVWDSHQAKWEQMFRELLDYKKENGDCDVPAKYPPNKALGLWATRQRMMKREAGSNPSKATLKRMRMLESVGFMWGSSYPGTWEKMYNEMTKFKLEHGHCNVSKEANPLLFNWISGQRCQLKHLKSNDGYVPLGRHGKRISLLDSIGFPWEENGEFC